MRVLRNVLAIGAVLAMAGTAMAGTIGSDVPWSGDYVAHLSNLDASRIYTGYLANGTTPVTPGVAYTDPTNQLQYYTNPILGQGETSFGVFRIDNVYTGSRVGPNNIAQIGGAPTLWTDGDGGMEIVGIFYGRTDTRVVFNDDAGSIINPADYKQNIRSADDNYKIYYQPKGTLASYYTGPFPTTAGRLAVDQFKGIGYSALNTTIAGSELVLTGGSVHTGGMAAEIIANFDPVSFTGVFDTFLLFDVGIPWNETDPYISPPGTDMEMVFPFDALGNPVPPLAAHAKLHTTTTAFYGTQGWDLSSSDPLSGGATAIPEPLTIIAAFLGISGLAGYMRKRRMA